MAKILLAEDDQFLRDIYTETLRNEKYDLTIVQDGKEAFEKISAGGWDLVLLDIIMPKMTGVEVLKKLKGGNLHSLAKYVVFTTNSEESKDLDEVKGLYDGYILKSSLTPGQLVEKVKKYLKS